MNAVTSLVVALAFAVVCVLLLDAANASPACRWHDDGTALWCCPTDTAAECVFVSWLHDGVAT